MEFEDILEEVGSYGPYQRNLLMLFAAPVTFTGPFLAMSLIFVITVPEHWCHVPEIISSNLSIYQQRTLIEAPENPQCRMKDLNYTELVNNGYVDISNNTNTTNCKYGWEYDKNDFEVTAGTKWNMVCDTSNFPSLILTLQMAGSLVGTPIYGAMSDRWGRKITLFVAVFVTVMTEIFSIITSSLTLFAILKGINGAIIPTIISLPYILVSEVVTPNKRVFSNGVVSTAWMFGMCALPLIVYLSRSWIILGIFNTLIGAIIALYWKFVPESPIWLISMERYEEALDIMIRIGEKNKRVPDKDLLYKKLKVKNLIIKS